MQNRPAPKKEKPVKTKYCSRCGSVIGNKTKTCTRCGKQYFRGFRFTKFSVTVIALAFLIATVSTLCVLQYINTQELRNEISNLERQVSTKKFIINRLENEVDDLEDEKRENLEKLNFYDRSVVVIGDDGTKMYHKYGCSKLDTSNGYWILNEEAADYDGYKRCSRCND